MPRGCVGISIASLRQLCASRAQWVVTHTNRTIHPAVVDNTCQNRRVSIISQGYVAILRTVDEGPVIRTARPTRRSEARARTHASP